MKDKYISYYELLGMIKEGNIPKRLYVKLPQLSYGVHYIAEYDYGDFSFYYIEEPKEGDVNYKDYLGECFLESSMFEKCIQVLDEGEFEDIEEIELANDEKIKGYYNGGTHYMTTNVKDREVYIKLINQLIKNQKKIIQKLNKEN